MRPALQNPRHGLDIRFDACCRVLCVQRRRRVHPDPWGGHGRRRAGLRGRAATTTDDRVGATRRAPAGHPNRADRAPPGRGRSSCLPGAAPARAGNGGDPGPGGTRRGVARAAVRPAGPRRQALRRRDAMGSARPGPARSLLRWASTCAHRHSPTLASWPCQQHTRRPRPVYCPENSIWLVNVRWHRVDRRPGAVRDPQGCDVDHELPAVAFCSGIGQILEVGAVEHLDAQDGQGEGSTLYPDAMAAHTKS